MPSPSARPQSTFPRAALTLAISLLAACSSKGRASFHTEAVTRGPVAEVVSATGEVGAVVTVNVGSQVSGTISRLHVDFNSPVTQGQLLAEIDPRLFQAALERAAAGLAAADANVERAKVSLADAERTYRRTIELSRKSLVAQADIDTALAARDGAAAALKGADAGVLQARAEKNTAGTNVALCRISSPIDGVVISRNIDVGQTVAAAFQAPTLFTIANDLSKMQILANIDEADIGKVKEGLPTRFTVDAFPGEEFAGTIREIRHAPNTLQNVVTYPAVIDAPNPEHKLRQGMTAAVTIVTRKRDQALRVPNAALRWKPSDPALAGPPGPPPKEKERRPALAAEGPAPAREGMRVARVYRLEGNLPVPAQIKVGLSDGHQSEVLEGLDEGQAVIVGDSGSGGPPPGMRRGPF